MKNLRATPPSSVPRESISERPVSGQAASERGTLDVSVLICTRDRSEMLPACLEAVLLDESGHMTEGSHTSVFGVKNGNVITTPLSPHILPGITLSLLFAKNRRSTR